MTPAREKLRLAQFPASLGGLPGVTYHPAGHLTAGPVCAKALRLEEGGVVEKLVRPRGWSKRGQEGQPEARL